MMINVLKKIFIHKIVFIIVFAVGPLICMEEPVKPLTPDTTIYTPTLQARLEYLKFYHQIPSDLLMLGDMPCDSIKIYAEIIRDGVFNHMIRRYFQLLHDEIDFPHLSPDQREQFIRAGANALRKDTGRMSYVWTGNPNKIYTAQELQPYHHHFKRVVETVAVAKKKVLNA